MATQLARFLLRASPLVAIWFSLFVGIGPLAHFDEVAQRRGVLLLLLPLVCLICLSVYAVGSVLYGVLTFNDCASARERLISEINEAKEDLTRRGIIQQETNSQAQPSKEE